MNVALFADIGGERVNGALTCLRAAVEHAPAGIRLRIYTAADVGFDTPDMLTVASRSLSVPFSPGRRMHLPPLASFTRHARAERIDVVHLATTGAVGVAAVAVALKLDLPIVGSVHGPVTRCEPAFGRSHHLRGILDAYSRWLYGHCSRVLVPSEHARCAFGAHFDGGRLTPSQIGVNTRLFSPERRSAALRERWHVADHRPAMLYVGRLAREKDVDLLPGISDRLHSQRLEHRFVVVGDGPLRAELQDRMPDAVFTGVLAGTALSDVFASADLLVHPSRTDVAGHAVLEAQASGIPVVVSGAGGAHEHMLPQRSGIICRGRDPSDWVRAIAELLQFRLLRREMGHAARQFALTRPWDAALEPWYGAYREAAAAVAPAAPAAWGTAPPGRGQSRRLDAGSSAR